MAQPQGLNIPAIITTGLVTVILTGVIVEGVRALYAYEEPREEARKWEKVRESTVNRLRDEQEKNIKFNTSVPIDAAITKVIETGGKMPSTQPNS
ncbi:MAG TPA: hypothetical protein VF595_03955 [Tepidisphaeraceae bacterium]|jgi:hypothetical protein